MQIPLIAVAALAMFAMAAALLLAGDAQAHATTTTIAADGDNNNPLPQQNRPTATATATATATPRPHATPEACPGEPGNPNTKPASVVDEGQYALFDVYWNPVEGELTNNVCPPIAVYVPATRGQRPKPARTDRSPSSINIAAEPPTIIHIPSTAKVNLRTDREYPRTQYEDVYNADNAENPNGDGDGMVWVLPACPTDDASELCISYSAALLNPDDWKASTNIDFIVTHVHQVDIDKQDRRYVLVYDVPATGKPALRWYSRVADTNTVGVAPGEYDRPMWFFPSRGAYEFQVYFKGYPKPHLSEAPSVTSDYRYYILHVGAEADLSVGMTVAPDLVAPDTTLDPGDNVIITVTASNAGPDTAPSTKVDVPLPDGLTYSSQVAATGTTYDATTEVWTIGALAKDASKTLTITATVDAGTHGQTLTAKATISATETVTTNSGTYEVSVPDEDPDNNMATGSTTVASLPNVDPMFVVTRSVAENSQGVNLGDPVPVMPGDDDPLTYGLEGVGKDNFNVTAVTGGAQLSVADDAVLNYEDDQSYTLILTVSDGKDDDGNDNSNSPDAIDGKIAVKINITDVANEQMIVTLSADRTTQTLGQSVTLTAKVTNSPVATSQITYYETYEANEGVPNLDERYGFPNSSAPYSVSYSEFAVTRGYEFSVRFDPPGPDLTTEVTSNTLSINWTN